MKKVALIIMVALAAEGFSQDMGIGLRLGDPTGVTFKKYMDGSAIEVSVGRSHWYTGRGWYDGRFNDWYYNQNYNYAEFRYVGYRATTPVGIQFHYLIQKDFSDIEGLQYYYGGGAQLRYQTFTYEYRYKIHGDNDWFYASGQVTDIDLGVDGTLGLEYIFEDAPLSIFLDVTLFLELADNPFVFWGQSGIGVRYNF